MELSERIKAVVAHSGLSIPKFANKVGFKTPQAVRELLKGNTKTLSDAAQYKILTAYPQINRVWLLTGEGPMLARSAAELKTDTTPADTEHTDTPAEPLVDRLLALLEQKDALIRSQAEQIGSLQARLRDPGTLA